MPEADAERKGAAQSNERYRHENNGFCTAECREQTLSGGVPRRRSCGRSWCARSPLASRRPRRCARRCRPWRRRRARRTRGRGGVARLGCCRCSRPGPGSASTPSPRRSRCSQLYIYGPANCQYTDRSSYRSAWPPSPRRSRCPASRSRSGDATESIKYLFSAATPPRRSGLRGRGERWGVSPHRRQGRQRAGVGLAASVSRSDARGLVAWSGRLAASVSHAIGVSRRI